MPLDSPGRGRGGRGGAKQEQTEELSVYPCFALRRTVPNALGEAKTSQAACSPAVAKGGSEGTQGSLEPQGPCGTVSSLLLYSACCALSC